MIIWGISALFHDAGLSVIKDNELVFGAHAERYSGVKHDKHIDKKMLPLDMAIQIILCGMKIHGRKD